MNSKYKIYILLTFLFWATSSYGFNWNKYSEFPKKTKHSKKLYAEKNRARK